MPQNLDPNNSKPCMLSPSPNAYLEANRAHSRPESPKPKPPNPEFNTPKTLQPYNPTTLNPKNLNHQFSTPKTLRPLQPLNPKAPNSFPQATAHGWIQAPPAALRLKRAGPPSSSPWKLLQAWLWVSGFRVLG